MLMSCNQKHLWREYDQNYLQQVATLFIERQDVINLWTTFEPNQARFEEYIAVDIAQLMDNLRHSESLKTAKTSLDVEADLLGYLKLVYCQMQNIEVNSQSLFVTNKAKNRQIMQCMLKVLFNNRMKECIVL